MATNHLKTANKYIEKQISKLRLEQSKLLDKSSELSAKANVIEDQIKALYETQDKLLTPEQRAEQLELTLSPSAGDSMEFPALNEKPNYEGIKRFNARDPSQNPSIH